MYLNLDLHLYVILFSATMWESDMTQQTIYV